MYNYNTIIQEFLQYKRFLGQVRDTKKIFSFTKPLYLLVSLAICCQKNDNV